MAGPVIAKLFYWSLAAIILAIVLIAGALMETASPENTTWFVVLLVTGILGLGLIPMLVYLLAEPDPGRVALPAASAN